MTMLMSLIVIIISPFVCIYIHTQLGHKESDMTERLNTHTHTHNYHGVDIKIYNIYLKIFNGIKPLILNLKKLPYLLYPFIR